jgi:hypothetical protein
MEWPLDFPIPPQDRARKEPFAEPADAGEP